jgi:hypothetical protein
MNIYDRIKEIIRKNDWNNWSYKYELVGRNEEATKEILDSDRYQKQMISFGGKNRQTFHQCLDIQYSLKLPTLGLYNLIHFDNYKNYVYKNRGNENNLQDYLDSVTTFVCWLNEYNNNNSEKLTLLTHYNMRNNEFERFEYTLKVSTYHDTLNYYSKLVENHARILNGNYFPYSNIGSIGKNKEFSIAKQLNDHGYVEDECDECKILKQYIEQYNEVNHDKPMKYLEKEVTDNMIMKNSKICTAQIFIDLSIE